MTNKCPKGPPLFQTYTYTYSLHCAGAVLFPFGKQDQSPRLVYSNSICLLIKRYMKSKMAQ